MREDVRVTQETKPESGKICPFMTGMQLIPRVLAVQVTPVGMAQMGPQLNTADLKSALQLPQQGRELPVYKAEGRLGYSTQGQPDKENPNPPLIADTIKVPCVREKCMLWNENRTNCTFNC